jgi:hypothetical protein
MVFELEPEGYALAQQALRKCMAEIAGRAAPGGPALRFTAERRGDEPVWVLSGLSAGELELIVSAGSSFTTARRRLQVGEEPLEVAVELERAEP